MSRAIEELFEEDYRQLSRIFRFRFFQSGTGILWGIEGNGIIAFRADRNGPAIGSRDNQKCIAATMRTNEWHEILPENGRSS